MMQLRDYQQAAVNAIWEHLRTRDDNPCVVFPTGGGKSPVMGKIVSEAVNNWGGRVLLIAHVKELLEQNIEKIKAVCPGMEVGAYSASLRRRDTRYSVIVAGIQSIYKRACELGAFDLIVIDEAHLIPPSGDGMYRTFLADMKVINPNVRVIGLTATAFRTKDGDLCTPDGVLNHICYEISVRDLIDQGYLSNLISKSAHATIDTSGVSVRAGEFVAEQLETAADDDGLVRSACDEIYSWTRDGLRKGTLIFATGIKHGRHIVETFREKYGVEVGFVTGETPAAERAETLSRFRGSKQQSLVGGHGGPLRYLCNVNVLTTGFDAPHIDCVALLRPTMSPGLYYQMVGRGFRLSPNKLNCLVLDFGGNVERHGPVDALRVKPKRKANESQGAPEKTCPECGRVTPASSGICGGCGFLFQPPDRSKHDPEASAAGVLSGQKTTVRSDVQRTTYRVHTKRSDPQAPKSMRVEYWTGLTTQQSEWICFEHEGWARQKAEEWWARRCALPCPATAVEAVALANQGHLTATLAITVESVAGDPKATKIKSHELALISEPEAVES